MARKRSEEPGTPVPPEPAAGPEGIEVPGLESNPAIGSIPSPAPDPDAEPAPGSPETGLGSSETNEPAPKRRRGARRSRKAQEEAPAPIMTAEDKATFAKALGGAFGAAGRIAAARRGRHWALSDDERAELGNAWAEALAPYLGAAMKHAPLITAAFVTYQVIDQRLQLDAMQQVIPAPTSGVEVGRVS